MSVKVSKLLLPVVLLSVFVMPISISGTSVALPDISRELGTDPTLLQWVINGFNVFAAIFMLVWGVFSDRAGYRLTFVLGVFILIGANTVSALAPSLLILDLGRVLAGIGGAAVFAGAAAILSNVYKGAARGRAFALFGTTIGLGVALGPTIAGALTAAFGWRGVFVAFVIFTVVSALGIRALPHIAHDHVPGSKFVDFSLLRNKRFLAFALVPVAQAFGYVTVLTYLPVAFSAINGLNAGTVGLVMLPATIPVFLAPVIAAQLIKRVSWATPMVMINVALVSLVIGDVGLLLVSPTIPIGWLLIPLVLLGFGFGFPIGLVDAEALSTVDARNSGTAAGVVNFLRLGSEAIAVGAYALVIVALVGASLNNATLTAETAAGHPGQGTAYASALHIIVLAVAALTMAFTILINILFRSHASTLTVEPAGTPASDGAVSRLS